jgi:hypothetical protein
MAATVYKPAHNAAVAYSGVTYKCATASIEEQIEEFETTNTESNGAYEFGLGVRSISMTFECPVVDTTGNVPAVGTFATATWSDGISSYSGDGALTQVSRRGGGRGGFTFSGTLKFTGAVTKS